MELRHLRYFIAVAEELHFGRAAQRLHMAQQPLSRQIQNLEKELDVRLFQRTKRTVRLTEVGHIFLEEAKKTLKQADQAILLAQQTSRGEIGQFAIGYTGPALNRVLPQVVRQFKAFHPKVDLTLERLLTNDQVNALLTGAIQVGLLHPPLQNHTLSLETIHRENLVVMMPSTHPLAKAAPAPLSIQDLAEEPFILFPRPVGPVLYDQIISLCRRADFSPNVVQEVVPQQTILGLVAVGIGITFLHASAQKLGYPEIIARPLVEPTPQLELAIAWHPETTNPVLPLFLDTIRHMDLTGTTHR